MSSSTAAEPVTGTGWHDIADELADALQASMLRNPSLTARAWDRAHAALGRYERAGEPADGETPEVGDSSSASTPENHEADRGNGGAPDTTTTTTVSGSSGGPATAPAATPGDSTDHGGHGRH